jgi:phospholipase/carboxylesterase
MTLPLVHRVRLPGTDPHQVYPAVVMVHGWLGDETVMSIFERTLPLGVVMVSPRGPWPADDQSYGWFAHDDDDRGSFASGLAALSAFVHALPDRYPVDAGCVALVGFSQGAAISFALALSEPEAVTAVAGLAGFLPKAARDWLAPGRLAGKPIFMAHGQEDDTIPIERARQAAEALRGAGAKVNFHDYPVGHKLNADGMADLKAWLADFRANCP